MKILLRFRGPRINGTIVTTADNHGYRETPCLVRPPIRVGYDENSPYPLQLSNNETKRYERPMSWHKHTHIPRVRVSNHFTINVNRWTRCVLEAFFTSNNHQYSDAPARSPKTDRSAPVFFLEKNNRHFRPTGSKRTWWWKGRPGSLLIAAISAGRAGCPSRSIRQITRV